MRSNSGLERFHRSSICHRSLSATSCRAGVGCAGLRISRGPAARAVPPTRLGESSWFDWVMESYNCSAHPCLVPKTNTGGSYQEILSSLGVSTRARFRHSPIRLRKFNDINVRLLSSALTTKKESTAASTSIGGPLGWLATTRHRSADRGLDQGEI